MGKITGTRLSFPRPRRYLLPPALVCVGAGEDDPPPEKQWHHCWRPPHSGNLRRCSCVLRLSVYRAYWKMLGDRCVWLGVCCLEPKLQGMTSRCGGIGLISCQTYRNVRYRIDDVPILPKCPVPVSMLYRYRTGSGTYVHTGTAVTGIDVVPNLPKCPVPVLMPYRTYRSQLYTMEHSIHH